MTDADRGRFAEALLALAETRGETISDRRAEAYFFALNDLDLPNVLYAIHRAMQTGIYPKLETPGRLRELVAGSPDVEGETAWFQVLEAVRSVGSYRLPNLSPVLMATVTAIYGGWQQACATIPAAGEWGHDAHRKRFASMHSVMQARHVALPPHLLKLLGDGS